jgi:hypothetical protein
MKVRVQQSNGTSLCRKRTSQICRHGAFPHPALAAAYNYNMFYKWQQVPLFPG